MSFNRIDHDSSSYFILNVRLYFLIMALAVSVILIMECTVASCTENSNYDEHCFFRDPTATVFTDDNQFLFDKAKVLERYNMHGRLTKKEMKILEKDGDNKNFSDAWCQSPNASVRMNVCLTAPSSPNTTYK